MSRLVETRSSERVRPGGRSEDVRRRVATACIALLASGEAGFGPTDVARISGVSRSTINRWWPTKTDLLREALREHTAALSVPNTGVWEDDLGTAARQFAAFFADPLEVSQNALMASGEHPDYEAAVIDHYESFFDSWRARVDAAREAGQIQDTSDADVLLLALASPLVLVPLVFHRSLTDREVDQIADLVRAATTRDARRRDDTVGPPAGEPTG